ncbi:hypothetical protein RhiirA1_484706, partial [Rhizophagus irregularis]
IGEAYPTCYEGGRDIDESQFDELGINKSITHEDFMIGSSEMDIDGVYMTKEQEYVLNQFIQAIDEEQPDVVIIAGDLYDRAVPPVEASNPSWIRPSNT